MGTLKAPELNYMK